MDVVLLLPRATSRHHQDSSRIRAQDALESCRPEYVEDCELLGLLPLGEDDEEFPFDEDAEEAAEEAEERVNSKRLNRTIKSLTADMPPIKKCHIDI